ncbi:MAG: response regulator [Sedimenticola sp.]
MIRLNEGAMSEMKNVLVVDDSMVARMMVKEIIRREFPSWRVIEAKDSREALRLAADLPLDIMVVDYNMEGLDGLELCKQLKVKFPNIQGALLTANIQDVLRQRAEEGGLMFINKPVNPDLIIAFLKGE